MICKRQKGSPFKPRWYSGLGWAISGFVSTGNIVYIWLLNWLVSEQESPGRSLLLITPFFCGFLKWDRCRNRITRWSSSPTANWGYNFNQNFERVPPGNFMGEDWVKAYCSEVGQKYFSVWLRIASLWLDNFCSWTLAWGPIGPIGLSLLLFGEVQTG